MNEPIDDQTSKMYAIPESLHNRYHHTLREVESILLQDARYLQEIKKEEDARYLQRIKKEEKK